MKNNKDFTIEVDEVYKCKEPVEGKKIWWSLWLNYPGAVCCEVCKENCHHPCTLAWYTTQCEGKEGSEESVSLLETLQKNIEDLQKDKDQFLEESFQHVVRLEEIALKGVSLSTQVHLDFLIEKMKEKGDTEKVKKLEEMKRKWMKIQDSNQR
ncbi:hypothetical protein F7725_021264 [Dissostichus mawsoni]|uniref:Uncharacterized protein n=1 Tax=Dissostichus mawsoni TaxID=36200 RepID=A0A7J5YFJ1_DISMA|nr:hypothetical protein F7725_021264 [Dissostichus mawsoni]